MKTKLTLVIAAVALLTLSFTFASVKEPIKTKVDSSLSPTISQTEPVGGLIAEDVVN